MPPARPPTFPGQEPDAPQAYEIHIRAGYTTVAPVPPSSLQPSDSFGHPMSDTVDGTLRVPAGHEISLSFRLREQGANLVVHDHRVVPIRLFPDRDACDAIGASDAEYVNAVVSNFRGVIESRTLKSTVERIATLCSLFPRARVLIPVPNLSKANLVQAQLTPSLEKRVRGPGTGAGTLNGTCWVTSFAQMLKQDPADWDLVLIPELARSTGKVAQDAFVRFGEFAGKLFGFASTDDCVHASLPRIAGPVVHRETKPRVGVQMAWLSPRAVTVQHKSSTRKFKETGYYRNVNRNQFIAAVARGFRDGKVLRYGVPMDQGVPAIRGGQHPSIVILVETKEHGQVLQHLLGDTAVLVTLDDDPGKYGPGIYITTVASTLNPWIEADVVIVASGELALLNIPEFPPCRQNPDDADVLIIDFLDLGDTRMMQARLDRYRAGYSRGWRDAPWSAPGDS